MFTKMVDMAKSAEDVKKEMADFYPAPSTAASTSVYPYGLCISFDDDVLKKLDLDGDMPSVGETIHFEAMAKVTCASMNEREEADGTKKMCKRIELQITNMGVPSPEPKRNWYGKPPMVEDNDNDGE